MTAFGIDPYENLNQAIGLPAELRKTWRYDTGQQHWQVVDCGVAAQFGECPHYANGFVVEVPHHQAEQARAAFLGEGYTFLPIDAQRAGHTAWMFLPEQQCLRQKGGDQPHRVRLEHIAPQLTVVEGDHRGNPRGEMPLVHTSADTWMSHAAEHAAELVKAQSGAAGLAPGAPLPRGVLVAAQQAVLVEQIAAGHEPEVSRSEWEPAQPVQDVGVVDVITEQEEG